MAQLLRARLARLAPRFDVPAGRIRVLTEPAELYAHLCRRIETARSRIFLASLYMGVNGMNAHLVDLLDRALQRNRALQVSVLMDALRSTREAPRACAASLLAPLRAKYPGRVRVALYKTPKLPAFLQHLIPRRVVEGAGLQHMKLYGFDDEILLSGANLSQEYYERRQDRYIAFRHRALCEYFYRVHAAVSALSLRLQPSDDPKGFALLPPEDAPAALERLRALVSPDAADLEPLDDNKAALPPRGGDGRGAGIATEAASCAAQADTVVDASTDTERTSSCHGSAAPGAGDSGANARDQAAADGGAADTADTADTTDTVEVYPVCQFSPLGFGNETAAVLGMAECAAQPGWKSTFTAGYFNVYPELGRLLARASDGTVVIAAPQANGFYRSKGASSVIPAMYALSALRFASAAASGVRILQWQRGVVNTPGGWSYHAKGFWLERAGRLVATYIGSSNFTYRSHKHDLECGAVLLLPEQRAPAAPNPVRTAATGAEESEYLSAGSADQSGNANIDARAIRETGVGAQLRRELHNIEQYATPVAVESIYPRARLRDVVLFKMMKKRL